MLKNQVILAVALLTVTTLLSQDNQAVLLVSSDKTLSYQTPDGSRFKSIQPGAVLLKNNLLTIPKKSTAVVFSDGVFKQLPAGKHLLSQALGESTNTRTLGFDNTMGSYLNASISLVQEANGLNPDWARLMNPQTAGDGWGVTDPKKAGDGWGVTDPKKAGDGWGVTDPKKAGDGWGVTDPKKAGDGWGGTGHQIHAILPFGWVLPENRVHFSWSRPVKEGVFQVRIHDQTNSVVQEFSTRDTFIAVNLTGAPFSEGAHFTWTVQTSVDQELLISKPLEFSVGSAEAYKAAMQPLRSSKIYPTADAALRGLMEATALERAEWFYSAAQVFENTKRQFPENNTVRMMYATFWMRYGLVPLAHRAVQKQSITE